MRAKYLTAALCALAVPAVAQAAPTNEELLDMVLENQKSIEESHIKFSKTTGTPEWKSADGKHVFGIGGRVMTDVSMLPDMYKKGKTDPDDFYGSTTKSEVRKIYLAVEGQFHDKWEYEVKFDFAENEVDIKDANLVYNINDTNDITLGWQKPRFGMESTTSSKYLIFQERGFTDSFSPDRGAGINHRWKYGMGITQLSFLIPNSVDGGGDDTDFRTDANIWLARATFVPVETSTQTLHLGLNGGWYKYDNGGKEELEIDAKPNAHLAEKLVAVGFDNPESNTNYAVEAAWNGYGIFAAAEYAGTEIEAENGEKYSFDAYYGSLLWMITGEDHGYKKSSGYFKKVKPENPISKGGLGAWEIGARYSAISLSDQDEFGGDMETVTFALNWYLENNIKMTLNYVMFEADGYDPADVVAGDRVADQDGEILTARLAYFF